MLHELVIAHAPRTSAAYPLINSTVTNLHGLTWQTCLRKLILCKGKTPLPGPAQADWEMYYGERAYQFLLEIICGLHSPLVGETEVLGQFREFCATAHFPKNNWGQFLRQLLMDLLRDAKRIRHEHLQQLGHRSYGTLASQVLSDSREIAVLGAGQLVQEMAPALLAQAELRIFARQVAKAAAGLPAQSGVSFHQLTDQPLAEPACRWSTATPSLVIAAPLSARAVQSWVQQQGIQFSRVLDLRGESVDDPLELATEVMDLPTFFSNLQAGHQHAAQRAQAARAAIAQLAQRQLRQVQCRPYGWEDLCA